ncbi:MULTISPECIES: thioesterase II family protein [Amycolatopsis]|uniref:Thioesterase n=1 Tax=Amycolatopsis bullii TaxID=941987 RepID=A0ABQ3KK02_9PSEU|nr:alpha/beta fold hydrolase [Amycolatopsis bullii]GHG20807.1 thioesterase [Amycolatopsis bullii]
MADNAEAQPWIRRYHPIPDVPVNLVCLPHAGGSASYFFPVSRALAPRVGVLAVQYPGRQDRRHEPGVPSIGALADAVTEALRPHTGTPLAIFGHSMGATLGFEVALRLESAGVTPLALFASGRRAPSCHRDERYHLLGDREFVAEIKSLSGANTHLLDDEELLATALPALRSDYRAAETYRYEPGPPLHCPIHALVGESDRKATVAEAQAWAGHTTAEFTLHTYPGGHFYLDEQAPRVLDVITQALTARHLSNTGK